jgi:hypothetical protein
MLHFIATHMLIAWIVDSMQTGKGGDLNFDQRTRSKTLQSILQHLDADGVKQHVLFVVNVFNEVLDLALIPLALSCTHSLFGLMVV